MRRSLLMPALFVCVLPFCPGARADTFLDTYVSYSPAHATSVIFADNLTGAPTLFAGDTFNFYGVASNIMPNPYENPFFRFSYTTPTTFTATLLQSETLSLSDPFTKVQYSLFNFDYFTPHPTIVGYADYTYTGSSDFVAGRVMLPLAPVAATPEPSSLVLLLTGLCSLALLGRRVLHSSVRS